MYKADYTNQALDNVYMYENISAYATIPDDNFIMLKFRGITTNYQRTCICIPSNADYVNPTYENNSRYWKLHINPFAPNWGSASQGNDVSAMRLVGKPILPPTETYNIEVYYRSDYALDTATATLIPELTPRIYVTNEDLTYASDAPVVQYTEYANNDLTSVAMSSSGVPTSASVDNRDVEYGVQTWTPTY
tara:strand:- start:6581 stop:7153 length:573 start_codon:yes stop_codon:yes gene_type:complete